MSKLLILWIVVAGALLAGCSANPLGMTDRERLRSSAYVEAARVQAEAQEHAATQETIRTTLWVAVLPWLAIIIVGGAVAGIVVWWQGRIWLARVERTLAPSPMLPPTLPRPQQEHPQLRELRLLAQRQGYDVEVIGAVVYLIDDQGNRVGRRLLTDGGAP